MYNDRVRVVDHAEPSLPQAHAVVGFFVICGLEILVKAAKFIPHLTRGQKERTRAVIHVPPEHVCRCERIVAAAVPEARTIPPYDAARLLKRAVQQNQPSAYRADVGAAADRC